MLHLIIYNVLPSSYHEHISYGLQNYEFFSYSLPKVCTFPFFLVTLPEKNKSMNANNQMMQDREIHFAVLAIGAAARRLKTSPRDIYLRLKKYDLIKQLLFDCYDTLHTESIDGVAWSVEEALKAREQ